MHLEFLFGNRGNSLKITANFKLWEGGNAVTLRQADRIEGVRKAHYAELCDP